MEILPSMLWISILVIAAPSLVLTCPEPGDIAPCSCFKATIYCQQSNMTMADLERVLKKVSAGFYQRIRLENLKLGNFSLEIFENVDVSLLEINKCELIGLSAPNRTLPVFGDTLHDIYIYKSINDTKDDFTLQLNSLQRLSTLVLYGNVIPHLSSAWFPEGLNSITRLIIDENGIERIQCEVFQNLVKLKELSLNSNKLQNISRCLLPKRANKLRTLNFGKNKISTVPEDFFEEMMGLEEFIINDNRIRDIPEVTWAPIWSQLKELKLDGNPLVCDSKIEWMFKVKRPSALYGSCSEPPERKYQYLEKIIDNHNSKKEDL